MSHNSCPFCSPHVSKAVFASSENFWGIYNIAPILPGHSLVVPKQHIHKFLLVEDELMTEMVMFSRRVIKILSRAFNTDSFDWTLQEGAAAGQTVEHMHIHIIPRQKKDLPKPGSWYPKLKNMEAEIIDSLSRPRLTTEEMREVVAYLMKVAQEIK